MEEQKIVQASSKPKKSKKTLILALSIVFVLLAGAGVGVAWMSGVLTFGKTKQECKLYWNVAEQTYLNGAGFSTRQLEDDGYYHVTLAVDGEQVEYKVKEKALVDDIDNRDIMGLEVDKEGVITAVYDPEEVCDGETVSKWYVVSIEEDGFKVRQKRGAQSGLSYQVKLTDKTGYYDVTGKNEIGSSKEVEVGDCVRVYKSFEKEVIYVFVVKGDDYFEGNIVKDYCEHCETEVEWYEWTESASAPTTTRHWRLMNDIYRDYHTNIANNQDVVIDLNGYKIESVEGRRVFRVGDSKSQGILAIVDQSKNQTGTLKAVGNTRDGGVVQVKSGAFHFYSGTIDASEVDTERYGCAVHIANSTNFNMYGGTIIGGTTTCDRTYTDGRTGGGGGSVYVSGGGTFTMYDGTIRDGKAVGYKSKTGSYSWGLGGNVHVRSGGTFVMEGGKILNGIADRRAGNVFLAGNAATFIMRGGEVSGGKAVTSGGTSGNVHIGVSSLFEFEGGTIKDGIAYNGSGGNVGVQGTMKMSGGHITGGLSVAGKTFETATKREDQEWHNIACTSTGIMEMSGGTVDGYVRIHAKECMIKLSGTARITGADANLSLAPGVLMRIEELTSGAKIGVTGGGFISEETSTKYLSYIESDYDGVDIQYYKNKYFMGRFGCLCGGSHINSDGNVVQGHYGACDGTQLEWMPWGRKANAPTENGNWYLITDVQLTAQKKVAADAKMVLDLNGYTIRGKENIRPYFIEADSNIHMTIVDHSEKQNGKIQSVGENSQAGSCILLKAGNEVVMYSGILDASNFKETEYGGTAIAVRKTSKFTMYGGTIIGGTTTAKGGSVVSEGTFVLHDGIIRDGKAATAGGNLCISNGEFTMLGGKILDGVSEYIDENGKSAGSSSKGIGGNIYIRGPKKQINVTIAGGTIQGGRSNGRGGNIRVQDYTNLVLGTEKSDVQNKAVILNGESASGGNLYASGDTTITIYNGIEIKDGTATALGGNICFGGKRGISIQGGLIENGAAREGGNLYIMEGSDGTITGGTISGGTADEEGGNIFNKDTLTVAGGTISGGTSSVAGGNIYTINTLNITGGLITGGKAIAEKPSASQGIGGNICVKGTKEKEKDAVYANVTITGGIIEKGESNGRGGNITASDYANLVLGTEKSDVQNIAVILGGESASGGNIYAINNSSITIYDGIVIKEGTATALGGNICFGGKKGIDIKGGQIENGAAREGGNLYIMDGSDGTITGGTISGGTATEEGGNIYNKGTLTVADGTISGGTSSVAGGNIYTIKTLNITGGLITGGKAIAEKPSASEGVGGNIYSAGTAGDEEKETDVVYATVSITGGTIENGESNGRGGNISTVYTNLVLGTEKSDVQNVAVISGGVSGSGGNVYAITDSSVVIYDGIVMKDGTATALGGNICYSGSRGIDIQGGLIENGAARDGGNLYIMAGSEGTITGGTISGGTATEEGGNIYNKNILTVNGGTISGGTATQEGGNIYNENGTLTVGGGTISGGAATTDGGNIYIQKGTMNMTDGTISGGTAVNGGSIYIHRTVDAEKNKSTPAILNMSGGTITGGHASGKTSTGDNAQGGGNIYCAGELIMSGGTIKDGTAYSKGGNVFVWRGTKKASNNYPYCGKLSISAGSILDGTTSCDRGGNVAIDWSAMEIIGIGETGQTGVIKITGGKCKAVQNEDGTWNRDANGTFNCNLDMLNKDVSKIQIKAILAENSEIGVSINVGSWEFAEIAETVKQTAADIIALNIFRSEVFSAYKSGEIVASKDNKGLTWTASK